MIKHDVRYIIRRVITAILIAFIFFFLRSTGVLAATKISAYQYRTNYYPCTWNSALNGCITTGLETQSGLTSFGTGTNGPKILSGFVVQLVTNNTQTEYFQQGQTCTLTWKLNFNPKTHQVGVAVVDDPIIDFLYWNGSEYVHFDSQGGATCLDNSNDSYAFNCTARWTNAVTGRYINITYNYNHGIPRSDSQGYNFRDPKISCTSDPVVDAIEDQKYQVLSALSALQQGIYNSLTAIMNNQTEAEEFLNTIKTDLKGVANNVLIITSAVNALNSGIGEPYDPTNTEITNWKNGIDGNGQGNNAVSGFGSLPGTFFNAYINGLDGVCEPISLGTLYNSQITIPCFDPSEKLGVIWTTIDLCFAIFIVYNISRKFVVIFHKFTELSDSQVYDIYGGGA